MTRAALKNTTNAEILLVLRYLLFLLVLFFPVQLCGTHILLLLRTRLDAHPSWYCLCRALAKEKETESIIIQDGEQISHMCGSCGKFEEVMKSFLCCARCRIEFYCSTACQRESWKEHKIICQENSRKVAGGASDY